MFSVEYLIRIPDAEYPDSFSEGDIVAHFNLPLSKDGLWHKNMYAVLPRIIETGYFNADGKEVLPLLSFDNVWIGEVVEIHKHVSYEDLNDDFFDKTIGGVKNTDELREKIWERYHKSLPDQTRETVLSQGVGVRKIKLIKRVRDVA